MHDKFTQEELLEQVEEIMKSFNFEKVHKHMVATDWKWASTEFAVPTLDAVKSHGRRLLLMSVFSPDSVTNNGSGGFTAYKLPWGLRLAFELVTSS